MAEYRALVPSMERKGERGAASVEVELTMQLAIGDVSHAPSQAPRVALT